MSLRLRFFEIVQTWADQAVQEKADRYDRAAARYGKASPEAEQAALACADAEQKTARIAKGVRTLRARQR